MLRGVRGATTVTCNSQNEIVHATVELVQQVVNTNEIQVEDIAAIIFSSTPDLNANFPATGVRTILGWEDVPLFGAQEIENPNGLPLCIRILLLWNTELPQKNIKHIYLKGAACLRK